MKHRDMLIKNIKMLMKNKSVTQIQLANAIGMNQPNLSKALNKEKTYHLSLDQVIDIADFFHVSIDSLVGHESKNIGFTTNPARILLLCHYSV
jgi:transcriptional regulator with XRE-family HTH domain